MESSPASEEGGDDQRQWLLQLRLLCMHPGLKYVHTVYSAQYSMLYLYVKTQSQVQPNPTQTQT